MAEQVPAIQFALFPTPLGDCGIAWCGARIIATNLPEQTPIATAARLAKRTGGVQAQPPPQIADVIRSVTELLDGQRTDLTQVACDLDATSVFERQVYDAARAIPAGETRTYGAIASLLGDKQLAQRVGVALGRNPLPIIVPCHRVLGANGKLTGFSAFGGIKTKLTLLEIERARIGDEPGLFDDLPPSG